MDPPKSIFSTALAKALGFLKSVDIICVGYSKGLPLSKLASSCLTG